MIKIENLISVFLIINEKSLSDNLSWLSFSVLNVHIRTSSAVGHASDRLGILWDLHVDYKGVIAFLLCDRKWRGHNGQWAFYNCRKSWQRFRGDNCHRANSIWVAQAIWSNRWTRTMQRLSSLQRKVDSANWQRIPRLPVGDRRFAQATSLLCRPRAGKPAGHRRGGLPQSTRCFLPRIWTVRVETMVALQ